MINSWTWWLIHDPDSIPDLTPHDSEEARDCLFGILGACLATVIFIALDIVMLWLVLKHDYNMFILPIGMLINTIIYVILIVAFMNLGFKLSEKIGKKRSKT